MYCIHSVLVSLYRHRWKKKNLLWQKNNSHSTDFTKNLLLLLFFSLLVSFFQKTVGARFSHSHFKHVSNSVHLLKTFYDLFSFLYLYYFARLHTHRSKNRKVWHKINSSRASQRHCPYKPSVIPVSSNKVSSLKDVSFSSVKVVNDS